MSRNKLRTLAASAVFLTVAGCGLGGGDGPQFEETLDLPSTVTGTLTSANTRDAFLFNLSDTATHINFDGDCEVGIDIQSGAYEAGGAGGGGCDAGQDDSGGVTDGAAHGYLVLTLQEGETGPLTYSFTVTQTP